VIKLDENYLYQMAKKVDLDYEPGISSEIRSLFEYLQNDEKILKKATLKFENETYLVFMEMEEYDRIAAKQIFNSFVQFIEYSYATFYLRKTYDNKVVYWLLSSTEDNKGFLSHIEIY
jgi:hypothetical protein